MLLPPPWICTIACILATQIQLHSATTCSCQSGQNPGNRISRSQSNAIDLSWLSDVLSGTDQKTVIIFTEDTNRRGIVEVDGAANRDTDCPCKQEKAYNRYNPSLNPHSNNFDASNSGFNAYSVNNYPGNTPYKPNVIIHDNNPNINTYPELVATCDSTVYIAQPPVMNNVVCPNQQSQTTYYPQSSSSGSNCVVTIVPSYNDCNNQDTGAYYDDTLLDCSCIDSDGYAFANYFGIN